MASLQSGGCALPAVTSHDLKVKNLPSNSATRLYIHPLTICDFGKKTTVIIIRASSHFLYYMEQPHTAPSMIDDNSVWSRDGSYKQECIKEMLLYT